MASDLSALPFAAEPMPSAAREVLWCLFAHGPTWDGDVPSKSGRDWLVERFYADRGDGWQWLTTAGALHALELRYGPRKEKWQRNRRTGSAK